MGDAMLRGTPQTGWSRGKSVFFSESVFSHIDIFINNFKVFSGMNFRDTKGRRSKAPKGDYPWRPAVYGLLVEDGKLLCQRPSWDRTKFCLPGGGMEKGESFEEALKREFLEETGFRIKVLSQPVFTETRLFGDRRHRGFFQMINTYFNAELVSKKQRKRLDEETVGLVWVDMEGLKSRDFTYFQRAAMKDILKE
jgi:8-oxo-dGTP diphosphatase